MKHRSIVSPVDTCVRSMLRGLCAVGFALLVGAAVAAPTVQFVATDLADVVAGRDLWRYDYTVTGDLASGGGVNILFGFDSYDAFDVIFADASVIAISTQPLPLLTADGLLSITALQDLSASDSALVSVQFDWLARGTPGAQPFEVVDNSFSVIATGITALPSVSQDLPEPSSVWLTGVALTGLILRRRRK